MQINVTWSTDVSSKFGDLAICIGILNNVCNQKDSEQVHRLKKIVYDEVRSGYEIEQLKENPTVRAYRNFYWNLGIDPTKTRPAGEALTRRALHGEEIPNISNVVDAYNFASMKTLIPISGFDLDQLVPGFQVRFAKENESFKGIGMKTPMLLKSNMLVLADSERVVSVYPYRDCDDTEISLTSRNLLIVAYGAPKITAEQLTEAVETALSFIIDVSGGNKKQIEVFRSSAQG